jgi:hypothetical protein
MGYLKSWIRASRLREMEITTLRCPTTGKLVCFANKTLLLTFINLVTLKVGLEHPDSDKWECQLFDVRPPVS